jgi:hypothetical protein
VEVEVEYVSAPREYEAFLKADTAGTDAAAGAADADGADDDGERAGLGAAAGLGSTPGLGATPGLGSTPGLGLGGFTPFLGRDTLNDQEDEAAATDKPEVRGAHGSSPAARPGQQAQYRSRDGICGR